MAKCLTFVAVVGAVASGVAAIQPHGAEMKMDNAPEHSFLESQIQDQIANMALEELMADKDFKSGFMSSVKSVLSEFSKMFLTELKPVVKDTCSRVVSKVAALSGDDDEDSDDSDETDDELGFAQTKSLQKVSAHSPVALSFAQTQFLDTMKKTMKSLGSMSGIKDKILAKLKEMIMNGMRSLLRQKVTPFLQTKANEILNSACDQAVKKFEDEASEF